MSWERWPPHGSASPLPDLQPLALLPEVCSQSLLYTEKCIKCYWETKTYYNHLFIVHILSACFTDIYCHPTNNSSSLIVFSLNKNSYQDCTAIKRQNRNWSPGPSGSEFHTLVTEYTVSLFLRKWLLSCTSHFSLLIFNWWLLFFSVKDHSLVRSWEEAVWVLRWKALLPALPDRRPLLSAYISYLCPCIPDSVSPTLPPFLEHGAVRLVDALTGTDCTWAAPPSPRSSSSWVHWALLGHLTEREGLARWASCYSKHYCLLPNVEEVEVQLKNN